MLTVDIHEVNSSMAHPNQNYISDSTWYLQTTVTWTFLEHPQPCTKCPNERIYKTPVTFILTFYPPMSCFLPFQLRLCFNPNDMERDLPPKHNILTTDIAIRELEQNEDPTLYALTLIYLIITLPPHFIMTIQSQLSCSLSQRTYGNSIRKAPTYMPSSTMKTIAEPITTPWKITYDQQDKDYSDHPNDRPR